MPKPKASEILKYLIQGISEDLTRKKTSKGIGKWNDIVPEKKTAKRPLLPKKYPKKMQDTLDAEEALGVKRGPGAFGKNK